MRLILCVKRDLHGCIFLNRLMPRLADHPTWILLSDKARTAESQIPELARLAYLERVLPIDRLFPLIDSAPAGGVGEWATFAGLAARYATRCEVVEDINSPAMLSRLAAYAPDLIVSARFSHIFAPAAIGVARHGVVNIHPGELPAYAGLFSPLRTVAEGGQELVCCLHRVDAGVDSGPIIALARLPYQRELGLLAQIAELYPLAITPLLDLLARLANGEAVAGEVQDRSRRRYRSLPDASEIDAFLAAGHHLWTAQSYDSLLARFLRPAPAPATP